MYEPPAGRGGALFVRAGSIIPMWPLMQYVGQKPVDEITLDIYPGADAEFTLYEDDGISCDYEQGAVAATRIELKQRPDGLDVTLGKREGRYKSMPPRPAFALKVHTPLTPVIVEQDGHALPADPQGWAYDPAGQTLLVRIPAAENATRVAVRY